MSCRSSVVRSSLLRLVVLSMAWLLLISVPAFATALDVTRHGAMSSVLMASDDDDSPPPVRKIGRKMGATPALANDDEPVHDESAEDDSDTDDAETGAGDSLPEGHYQCWAAGGVAGTLELNIDSDSEYSDRSGNEGDYVFDSATREITFESGPWEGFFGKLLTDTKIGIASRRGGFYGTSCDLK